MEDQESTDAAIAGAVTALDKLSGSEVLNNPKFSLELDCTVIINRERPVLEVFRETIKRLAEYDVSQGFEVYDYRD